MRATNSTVPVGGLDVHAFEIPTDGPDGQEQDGTMTWSFTDANGALSRKSALYWADRFHGEWGVCWFEEPVSSLDVEGLRLVRDRGPVGLDVAAGEYGFLVPDFTAWAGAVDCLQADVTRCGGITGLLQVGGLTEARQIDLSGHCAPAVSAHAFCGVPRVRHLEYFHTHVRLESLAFDGVLSPSGGALRPGSVAARPGPRGPVGRPGGIPRHGLARGGRHGHGS